MQPVRDPYRRSTWVLGALAVAGFVSIVAARAPGLPVALGRGLEIAGLLVGSSSALLFLGVWALGRSQRRALAALRGGEVFGSWRTGAQAATTQPVDVGAAVAVVGGELVSYATLHQRVVGVELARDRGALSVRGVYDNGHGDTAFVRDIPYADAFVEDAVRCGMRLAEHHGVPFDAGD